MTAHLDEKTENYLVSNTLDYLYKNGTIDQETLERLKAVLERKKLLWDRYADICLNENLKDKKECENILAELGSIEQMLNQYGLLAQPLGLSELEKHLHGESNPERVLKPEGEK